MDPPKSYDLIRSLVMGHSSSVAVYVPTLTVLVLVSRSNFPSIDRDDIRQQKKKKGGRLILSSRTLQ